MAEGAAPWRPAVLGALVKRSRAEALAWGIRREQLGACGGVGVLRVGRPKRRCTIVM